MKSRTLAAGCHVKHQVRGSSGGACLGGRGPWPLISFFCRSGPVVLDNTETESTVHHLAAASCLPAPRNVIRRRSSAPVGLPWNWN